MTTSQPPRSSSAASAAAVCTRVCSTCMPPRCSSYSTSRQSSGESSTISARSVAMMGILKPGARAQAGKQRGKERPHCPSDRGRAPAEPHVHLLALASPPPSGAGGLSHGQGNAARRATIFSFAKGETMDADAKKTALRMIPYGLFVITATGKGGSAAATINWVTQASFAPPLIAVGVKADSHSHALIEETREFVLNIIAKGDSALAYNFFKPATLDGNKIGGELFAPGSVVKA